MMPRVYLFIFLFVCKLSGRFSEVSVKEASPGGHNNNPPQLVALGQTKPLTNEQNISVFIYSARHFLVPSWL